MNQALLVFTFLAGLFFATSIFGWLCAHLASVRAAKAEAANHYLGLQWQQVVAHNQALAARNRELHEQLQEMGGDLPGDEWKNGNSNN